MFVVLLSFVHVKFDGFTFIAMWNVLLQKNVHATRFVEYMCLQVLPVLAEVGGDGGSDVQLELLKLLAEMVGYCGELSSIDRCTANIYNCLLARLLLTNDSFLTYR